MGFALFIKGILCGFAIAAPVGPVGILCAHRTLRSGRLAGIVSGLGAAAADTIFGAMAAFGLRFVADIFLDHQIWLRLVGGILLILVGGGVLFHAPKDGHERMTANGAAGYFISTFVLTITNPITILSFGAVFVAADAVVGKGDLAAAWTLIAGVFIGSALWFLSLTGFANMFRGRFDVQGLRVINRISGWLVIFLGVVVLLSLTGVARRTFGY